MNEKIIADEVCRFCNYCGVTLAGENSYFLITPSGRVAADGISLCQDTPFVLCPSCNREYNKGNGTEEAEKLCPHASCCTTLLHGRAEDFLHKHFHGESWDGSGLIHALLGGMFPALAELLEAYHEYRMKQGELKGRGNENGL